jgi:hypothetical protein
MALTIVLLMEIFLKSLFYKNKMHGKISTKRKRDGVGGEEPLQASTGPLALCPSGPLHPGRLSLMLLLSGGLASLFAVLCIASPSASISSLLFLG